MKIKIDAGYRSVDVSESDQMKYNALPYVEAEIEFGVDMVKYFNDQHYDDHTSPMFDALEEALAAAFKKATKELEEFIR